MAENGKVKMSVGITETGNLDRKQLESMKIADLKQLADEMGVDIRDNTKKENIINILTAIQVDTDTAAMKTGETAATAGAETENKPETGDVENMADAPAAENQTEESVHIYVGASLPGIKSNTTIKGKIPEILDVPFVRELVIPLNKFTDFIKKKAVTDSREAFCYRKSAEYAKTLQK